MRSMGLLACCISTVIWIREDLPTWYISVLSIVNVAEGISSRWNPLSLAGEWASEQSDYNHGSMVGNTLQNGLNEGGGY